MSDMFGFSQSTQKAAVIVDIGSSSVGVEVVYLHGTEKAEVLWVHREQSLIQEKQTPDHQLKLIKTALTNAFLELNQQAAKTLKEAGYDEKISEVQVTIGAPFSYTITKTISLKDEHPFEVTESMLEELATSAKKQSQLVFATNKQAQALGLEITHGDVIGVSINDYVVTEPIGQKGRTIKLSYAETAIASEVSTILKETIDKFFPTATFSLYSFMYPYYLTLRNLKPNTIESCLIDITNDATEMGIIRDDILKHSTYTMNGKYTIARELAEAAKIPAAEAYGYLKDTQVDLMTRLPKVSQEVVHDIFDNYRKSLASMFQRTGDSLAIPQAIFLHCDTQTIDFFVEMVEKAASDATGHTHQVHPITAKVLGMPEHNDAGLLIGLNFLINKQEYTNLLPRTD